MGARPSDKQMKYPQVLLETAGYGSRYMNAKFKEPGALMRQRSGRVEDWLRAMTAGETRVAPAQPGPYARAPWWNR